MNFNVMTQSLIEQAYLEIYEYFGKRPGLIGNGFIENELLHIEYFSGLSETFAKIWQFSECGQSKVRKSHLDVINDTSIPINIQENFMMVVNHCVRTGDV